jgi:hypothetical protein
MKINNSKYIIAFLAMTMVFMSCKKVFEDIEQYKNLTPEAVWSDADYTTQYINRFYALMYTDLTKTDAPATEEFGIDQQRTWTRFNTDQIAPGSASGIQAYESFTKAYSNIRDLNRFFENVDKGTYKTKNLLKGQAFFILAHRYFRLVKTFGGVPIVKNVINAESSDPSVLGRPRNSTLECFDYIISLLDSAIINLPEPANAAAVIPNYESFRVTKPIAMILKGEVLMWKASPIFCTTPDVKYWTDAYNSLSDTKKYLDSKGYGLYTTQRGTTPPYTGMYYDKVGAKTEWIWAQDFVFPTTSSSGLYKGMRPSNQGGDAEAPAPTWNLVERYSMADGKDTKSSSFAYNFNTYWKNRDPRFYQTIAYNGSRYVFPPNPTAIADPNRRQWTFTGLIRGDKPFELVRGGGFGFLNRKGIDTTLHNQELDKIQTAFPIYRYAEILLNLAECASELGKFDEAKSLLIPIRSRARILNLDGSFGLGSVPNNRTDWIKVIMNERLIELVYEGKRVWDIKRRILFEDFRQYKNFLGVQSTINVAGVDALKLVVPRNGATIVISRLTSLGLGLDDVWRALSDAMARSSDPDKLYSQIMTDRIIIGDLNNEILNPSNSNALEPIPSGTLLTDPKVLQSTQFGGTFNPKLN